MVPDSEVERPEQPTEQAERDEVEVVITLWRNKIKPYVNQYRRPILAVVVTGLYLILGNPLGDLRRLRRVLFAAWEFVAVHPIIENNPSIFALLALLVGLHLHGKGEGDFVKGAYLSFKEEIVPAFRAVKGRAGIAIRGALKAVERGVRLLWVNRGRLIDMSVIELFPSIGIHKIIAAALLGTGVSLGYVFGFFDAIPFIG